MKIIVTVGHSILKNGSCTSADGRSFHGVLEYAYNKEIVERIAAYLRSAGHEADTVVCPEYRFESSAEEKSYKLPKVNGGGYDLAVELHLNASEKHNARGCEAIFIRKRESRGSKNSGPSGNGISGPRRPEKAKPLHVEWDCSASRHDREFFL